MSELEQATRLLSRLVDASLQSALAGEPEAVEPALPIGQYL